MLISVVLPHHLRTLSGVGAELQLEVEPPVTQRAVIDAIEERFPMLCGTIRDRTSGQRRPLLRFFACQQDISLDPPDTELPDAVVNGTEPFLIIGSVAGG